MSARRAGTLAVAGVVATALLVVVLAAWASSIGPSDVLRGTGPAQRTATPTPSEATPGLDGTLSDLARHRPATPSWVRVVAVLIDVGVAVAVVALVLRLVVPLAREARRRRRASRDRRRRGGPDDVEFAVVTPPDAVAREILADAETQRRLLTEGAPRNAVVACWHRFEAHGAAAGVERHPWETSSEYTLRLLELVDAYQPAVSRLGELYREARFSEHEVTEGDRRAALAALDEIHRTIGVPA